MQYITPLRKRNDFGKILCRYLYANCKLEKTLLSLLRTMILDVVINIIVKTGKTFESKHVINLILINGYLN